MQSRLLLFCTCYKHLMVMIKEEPAPAGCCVFFILGHSSKALEDKASFFRPSVSNANDFDRIYLHARENSQCEYQYQICLGPNGCSLCHSVEVLWPFKDLIWFPAGIQQFPHLTIAVTPACSALQWPVRSQHGDQLKEMYSILFIFLQQPINFFLVKILMRT